MAAQATGKTDILTATENYGKARTAFGQALAAAAATREAAMYNLGADINTQSGKVLTPNEAAQALGPDGQGLQGTRMTTGFSTIGRGLSGIAQEQAATVYDSDIEAQERGLTLGSGIRDTARLVAREAGQAEKEKAIMAAQAEVAQAGGEEAAARAEERQALAALRTVESRTMAKPGKGKPKVKPTLTKQQQQRQAQQQKTQQQQREKQKAAGAQGRAATPQPGQKPTPAAKPSPIPKPPEAKKKGKK